MNFRPFQAIENGAKELLIANRIAHVVDGKDDDGFDAFFADPLWRDEPGEIAVRVVGVDLIEIGEPVAAGVGGAPARRERRRR